MPTKQYALFTFSELIEDLELPEEAEDDEARLAYIAEDLEDLIELVKGEPRPSAELTDQAYLLE